MKNYFLLFLCTINFFLAHGQTYSLTIHSGYGSGEYSEGDSIHIWADPAHGADVFTTWSGNATQYLKFDNEWHTILHIPEGTNLQNIELEANFDVLPNDIEFGQDSFYLWGRLQGMPLIRVYKNVHYGLLSNPKAMVFLFHGTGGQSSSFFTRFERMQIVKDLMFDGFAVFSFDSNETTLGDINEDGFIRWDNSNSGSADSTNNIELKNIAHSRDSIIAKYGFASDIPTYTLGMSNGAVFSDFCASALGYRASAHITARGRHSTYEREDIAPVIWVMSDNDHQELADNDMAFDNYTIMSENQIAEYYVFKRSPVYPERFLRSLSGIDAEMSQAIFNKLGNQGHLDEQNYLAHLEYDLSNSFFNQLGLSAAQRKDAIDQILAMNADHTLHADYNKNIIRFFNQFLETTAVSPIFNQPTAVNVYPNPTANSVSIISKKSKIKMIRVYNPLGELILSRTVNNNQFHLDLGIYQKAVYTLHIEMEERMEVKRIVKS